MFDEKKNPDYSDERAEFSFEEGVTETMRRIDEFFQSGQDYVVVAINGYIQVGKSRLASEIEMQLSGRHIPVLRCADEKQIESRIYGFALEQRKNDSNGGVVILDATAWPFYAPSDPKLISAEKVRENQDQYLHRVAKKLALPARGINIRISIYRPDKPETRKFIGLDDKDVQSFADIIVRNDQARDRIS